MDVDEDVEEDVEEAPDAWEPPVDEAVASAGGPAMEEKDDDTEELETRGTWLWWSRTGDMVSQGCWRMSSRPILSLGLRRRQALIRS